MNMISLHKIHDKFNYHQISLDAIVLLSYTVALQGLTVDSINSAEGVESAPKTNHHLAFVFSAHI